MKIFRICAWFVLAGMIVSTSLAAQRTTARLILSTDSARPGDTVMVGVELRMEPKWHTYWKNSGESGMPTKIDWQLPEGISAGEIQWPVPEKFIAADLTTYVYHNEVLLLVPLTLGNELTPGAKNLKAKVTWLECEEVCVPGRGDIAAPLLVGSELKRSMEGDRIDAWMRKLPQDGASLSVKMNWEKSVGSDTRPLVIRWVNNEKVETADFFPYAHEDYEFSGPTERLSDAGDFISLRKKVLRFGDKWPAHIRGVIFTQSATGQQQAREVTVSVASETGSRAGSDPAPSPGTGEVTASIPPPTRSLLAMLGLAFLGGLILNIMPCVLPVIALKILGFVNQSKESPGRVRQLGLIYASGVIASFLVLAGIVIGVQQAGRAASWGMQFQNPQFLIGMTLLVTLVALNLFGLFEITLSGGAMGAANTLASKEGAGGAFFHGVLATALATPCTAPFLGVALGFAFSQSPAVIVLMFATIGLGLAAPYVVLSWNPTWLRFIPKPGLWMQKFKIAMGFPMLATAFWLLWLTSSHFGRSGVLWLGMFLVTVAMASWIWGDFVQRGAKHRVLAMTATLALLATAYFFVLERQLNWRSPIATGQAGRFATRELGGIPWSEWSPRALEVALATGRPVLVDFTADWCVTCQVNKKTSLEIESVRAKLTDLNVVPLLGDYTNEDAAIATELKKYKRAGVPLVLIYPAGGQKEPYVLPEVLTPNIVLETLDKAAAARVASHGT